MKNKEMIDALNVTLKCLVEAFQAANANEKYTFQSEIVSTAQRIRELAVQS